MEWYVGVPPVDEPDCKTCIACHSSMNGTLSKESAVNIVGGIARDSSNHVSRICQRAQRKENPSFSTEPLFERSAAKHHPLTVLTYVLEVNCHFVPLREMILHRKKGEKRLVET